MYCMNCGQELPDQAQFCFRCGKAINKANNNIQTTLISKNTELDRSALLIYLKDLFNLEIVAYRQRYEYHINKKRLYALGTKNPCFTKEHILIYEVRLPNIGWGEYRSVRLEYDGKVTACYFKSNNTSKRSPYEDPSKQIFTEAIDNFNKVVRFPIQSSQDYEKVISDEAWEIRGRFGEKNRKMRQVRDVFVEKYNEFENKKTGIWNYNIKIEGEIRRMAADYSKTKALLLKAYAYNIIPKPFRNIYAINYLYNYLSTSQESLSNALLHYNLEEIKSKLDQIIQNQLTIISQQSIISAQNNALLQQNQSMLNTLASIEENTALSAHYSQIAANNAETCAWISKVRWFMES